MGNGLDAPISRCQKRIDVGRNRGPVHADDVAFLQYRPVGAAGQQGDELFADRGLAVYFGLQVRGDGHSRFQRKDGVDAGVGELDALDAAHLGAPVSHVATGVKPAGRGQLESDPVVPDPEQVVGQRHVVEGHHGDGDQSAGREDRHLGDDAPGQVHAYAP